jgi:hypothetical protein
MGHGQSQPLDGGTLSPDKPEDKLAKKANDCLQGDIAKQGFDGLNSQVTQQSQQEKLDRNLTLDQQLQKNGSVKIGIITRNFNLDQTCLCTLAPGRPVFAVGSVPQLLLLVRLHPGTDRARIR